MKSASFFLRILTPLSLLCNVDWQSYGSLSDLRSIFKSCKATHSISILSSVMHVRVSFESGLNRGFCIFSNLTVTHSSTHYSVKQHRRAMEEVSKCAAENCALYAFIQFSHKISVLDVIIYIVYRYFLCAVKSKSDQSRRV